MAGVIATVQILCCKPANPPLSVEFSWVHRLSHNEEAFADPLLGFVLHTTPNLNVVGRSGCHQRPPPLYPALAAAS